MVDTLSSSEILQRMAGPYVPIRDTDVISVKRAKEAMDEHAQQVAIAFSLWLNAESNGWFIVNSENGAWGSILTNEVKTTTELFSLFIKGV